MNAEIVTLSNGKRVANFSSPHSFKFTDGSVIPAQPKEVVEKYKVTFIENILNEHGDVELTFILSKDVWDRIHMFELMELGGKVDVIFCPLPMITALYSEHYDVKASAFRAVRIEDRIKKLLSIDKQCV